MSDYKDQTIVITGAAHGLGRALSLEFYKSGAHLALCDIDYPGLEKLKTEMNHPDQIISIHCVDVSNELQVIQAKNNILEKHGKIHILINNAGVSISQPFDQVSVEDFRWLFEINFWGTIYFTKHFLPSLKLQNKSKIVNILSSFAFMGFPGKSAYGASKAAILGFTNSLKTELSGTSVHIAYVIPPPIKTGIIVNGKHSDPDKMIRESHYLEKNGLSPEAVAQIIKQKIKTGQYRIIIGNKTFWLDCLSRIFPGFILRMIIRNKRKFDFI